MTDALATRHPGWLTLPMLPLRMLFTGYRAWSAHGRRTDSSDARHGRRFGISIDDIVYSYYGNRGNSRLEAKLEGSTKDKAPAEVRTEIVYWVQDKSPEDHWDERIAGLFRQHCIKCQGYIPGLPDFTAFAGVKPLAEIDQGTSIDSLTRVSHIHPFGIAFTSFFRLYFQPRHRHTTRDQERGDLHSLCVSYY